jgi:hypothetical protein
MDAVSSSSAMPAPRMMKTMSTKKKPQLAGIMYKSIPGKVATVAVVLITLRERRDLTYCTQVSKKVLEISFIAVLTSTS